MTNPTHTDICHSADPQVCAVFEAMNRAGNPFYPETTCAEMVKWFRAWEEAKHVGGCDADPR